MSGEDLPDPNSPSPSEEFRSRFKDLLDRFSTFCWDDFEKLLAKYIALAQVHVNLLRTAGRFIDQRHKGQERIILITIANKECTLMQI